MTSPSGSMRRSTVHGWSGCDTTSEVDPVGSPGSPMIRARRPRIEGAPAVLRHGGTPHPRLDTEAA